MAFGDITVTLRPIKFAFLVNPLESKQLDRVIRTSLFLWGGLHNPIIPSLSPLAPLLVRFADKALVRARNLQGLHSHL